MKSRLETWMVRSNVPCKRITSRRRKTWQQTKHLAPRRKGRKENRCLFRISAPQRLGARLNTLFVPTLSASASSEVPGAVLVARKKTSIREIVNSPRQEFAPAVVFRPDSRAPGSLIADSRFNISVDVNCRNYFLSFSEAKPPI